MPIHDQGYRRFAGTREPRGRAWLVIMKAGIRSTLARKWLRIILLASWAQFLVRAVVMYFTTTYGQLASSILATNAQTFREFLERQDIFVFFITIFVGAGLIANDRRANALQIYLSKPLTRAEYIAGKAGTLLVFLVAVTWVPAILLLAVQTMLAGNFTFVRANAFLLPAITVYAALQVLAEARDVPLSGALRAMIDFWVEQNVDEDARRALDSGIIASITPDPAWPEKHGTARPPA